MTSKRLTIEQKLQQLENRLDKTCPIHRKPAQSYCIDLSCLKCPYACESCITGNIHEHPNKIVGFNAFMTTIIPLMENYTQKKSQ